MNTNVIPVGGEEPVHLASVRCWCQPLIDQADPALVIHHAKDGRERFERQGIADPENSWVLVYSD